MKGNATAYTAAMARMLYLRDIEVDVLVRCCVCGHEGVLPRAMLERRFGINYPVLAIAPHYRCSHCNSRRVESLPATRAAHGGPSPSEPATRTNIDAPLAMLQGLLNSVRASAQGPAPQAREEEPAKQEAPHHDPEPKPAWTPISAADLDALTGAEPGGKEVAKDEADDLMPAFKRRVFAPTEQRPVAQAPLRATPPAAPPAAPDEEDAVETPPPEEVPLENTLAALRNILEADDDELEAKRPAADFPTMGAPMEKDKKPAHAFSPRALVRGDFQPEGDADEDEDEPSTEDILGFSIRDPERAPPPWERDRPSIASEDEPMEKTIEALRGMVELAAAEPDERVPAQKPRSPASRRPTPVYEPESEAKLVEGQPTPPANPAAEPDIFEKTLKLVDKDGGNKGQNGSAKDGEPNAFEKTISTLRGMLELDGKRRR